MSIYYRTEPSLYLPDKASTLAAIANPTWMREPHPYQYRVKSQWLCDELNRFEADGYVYNLQAQRRIEKENGLPEMPESQSPLSVLIYNAQGFRAVDNLRAQGFNELTPDLLERAEAEKKAVEIVSIGSLGGSQVCKVGRAADGRLYAKTPRRRNRGYFPDPKIGARLVARTAKPAPAKHEFIKIVSI